MITTPRQQDDEEFQRQLAAAEQQAREHAQLFVNSLKQIVDNQNALSQRVAELEAKMSHIKNRDFDLI
jgi:hypothetical protein